MKLIVANWKNHPTTREEAIALARVEDIEGLVIAPPEKFMSDVARVLEHATLGAQDYSENLKSYGVNYVIVGHSERRAKGETDAMVAKKIKLVVEQGMTPILCVGESAADHAAGRAKEFVREQLRLDLGAFHVSRFTFHAIFVAYEPIWAISTNPNATPDTPENAANMIHLIHEELCVLASSTFQVPRFPPKAPARMNWSDGDPPSEDTLQVLYGGSVDERNVESFLSKQEIDGCLVGGASLRPEAMKKIVHLAKKI